jgi:hypothetical protein
MNIFYDKYKKYKSKYLTMKLNIRGGSAVAKTIQVKFNCINTYYTGIDSKGIKGIDLLRETVLEDYDCSNTIQDIIDYIEEKTGNKVLSIKINQLTPIKSDQYKLSLIDLNKCDFPIIINYKLRNEIKRTKEEETIMLIDNIEESVKRYSDAIILLCPFAANATDDIPKNINQGLNIDAIKFANQVNKQLIIINIDLAFLSNPDKVTNNKIQTTDYLNMINIYTKKDTETEINIFTEPTEENSDLKKAKSYQPYYTALNKYIGSNYIQILNKIHLTIINFGINIETINIDEILKTLSQRIKNNYFCSKLFGADFPDDVYIKGEKISKNRIGSKLITAQSHHLEDSELTSAQIHQFGDSGLRLAQAHQLEDLESTSAQIHQPEDSGLTFAQARQFEDSGLRLAQADQPKELTLAQAHNPEDSRFTLSHRHNDSESELRFPQVQTNN